MQEQTERKTEVEEVLVAVRSVFILSAEERLTLFERVLELVHREYQQSSK